MMCCNQCCDNDGIINIPDKNTTTIQGTHQRSISISSFSSYIIERLSYISSIASGENLVAQSSTALDSHADSPVVGKHCVILEESQPRRTAKVSGFTSELGKPMVVPIVTAAVSYDCEYTGMTHVMVIHNALYFKNMEVNLIPPFMMRLTGLTINECPKFLSTNPSIEDHSIYFPTNYVRIPLQLEGTISYIPTRAPTAQELKENEGQYLLLTPNMPSWDPHTDEFKNQELAMVDYNGYVKINQRPKNYLINSVLQLVTNNIERTSIDCTADSTQFINSVRMLDNVLTGFDINSVSSGHRKKKLTAKVLARRLNIPVEMAKRTLQATTQHATRVYDDPTLTKKYRTNDRMLRYSKLMCDTFMDTMFSSVTSVRHFNSCQIFATEFGHIFAVPMEDKFGHNIAAAIKRYFKEKGVPLNSFVIVPQNKLKEQQGCCVMMRDASFISWRKALRHLTGPSGQSKL